MAIQVTVNAPRIYEWAQQATDDVFKVQFNYTKNRATATTLRIRLLSGTTLLGETTVDVSQQQQGATAQYTASIALNRTPASVTAQENSITVPGGSSVNLTPPTGGLVAVDAVSYGVEVEVNGLTYPFIHKVVAAQTITLRAPALVGDVTLPYYVIDSTNAASILENLTLEFVEEDANGNVIDSAQVTVEHAKPFQPITTPSAVDIAWLG